jgi:hypothetical protein
MGSRKPQINFQVEEPLKLLYDEAKAQGHWVTRFCAAGFLLMVEDPTARQHAINRLREWESEYESVSPKQIRAFVEGAQAALRRSAPNNRPARRARAVKKKARRD